MSPPRPADTASPLRTGCGEARLAGGPGTRFVMTLSRLLLWGPTVTSRPHMSDSRILSDFLSLVPQPLFATFLTSLEDHHACSGRDRRLLMGAYFFFYPREHRFGDVQLAETARRLRKSLDVLVDFLAEHFFPLKAGPGNDAFALHPEWRCDAEGRSSRRMEQYTSLSQTLARHVSAAEAAYAALMSGSRAAGLYRPDFAGTCSPPDGKAHGWKPKSVI